jgi:spore maturation protein CgeB
MNLVVFGLSITSGWANGHAALYRELLSGWVQQGHSALFLERTQPWYGRRRDLAGSGFCRVAQYSDLRDLRKWAKEVARADGVLVGSHVPDGSLVGRWVQEIASGVTVFYDLDGWETMARLERGDGQYVSALELPGYDLYLSTTGGPFLEQMESRHGVRRACPLYPSVDGTRFESRCGLGFGQPDDLPHRVRWEAGTYGTYCPGRQRQMEGWLLESARQFPESRFVVGGGGYPAGTVWPGNVERVPELSWEEAPFFFRGMKWYYHVMRPEQRFWGWSVGLGVLEAAASGVPTLTEHWEGMERFFAPGSEICVLESGQDFRRILKEMGPEEVAKIGGRARNRVNAEHSVRKRVLELESLILNAAEGWRGEPRGFHEGHGGGMKIAGGGGMSGAGNAGVRMGI